MKSQLFSRACAAVALAVASTSAMADTVTIQSAPGPFAKITSLFQNIVDFLGGGGTMFVVFVMMAGAIILWVSTPKNSGPAVAFMFRVACGALMLFSLGSVITYLQSL